MKNLSTAQIRAILVFLLSCLSNSLISQGCITEDPSESEYLSIPWYGDENSYSALDRMYDSLLTIYGNSGTNLRVEEGMILKVPLKFWLYQNGPGNPGGNSGFDPPDEAGLQFAVDRLNNAFRDSNIDIRFFISEVEFKNNSSAVDMNAAERLYFGGIHNSLTSLNVYVVDSGGDVFVSGLNGVFVNRESFAANNNSTLTHEIGHYFGLFHTWLFAHLPCYREPVSRGWILSACPPLVLSKRCVHTGDLLCDTNADPDMSENGNYNTLSCSWNGNGLVDAYGNEYTPNEDNFMAYGNRLNDCRAVFTSGQKKWMVVWAFKYKEAVLKGWLPGNNDGFDKYEPDNAAVAARTIQIGETQEHTFHNKGRTDVDWITFTAPACAAVTPLSVVVTEVTNNAVEEVAFFERVAGNDAGAEITASHSGNTYTLNAGILTPGEDYLIRVTPDNLNSSYDISIPFNSCISGPSLLCTSNSTFSLPAPPTGTTISWSVSPGSLFAVNSGTGTSFITRAGGRGFTSGEGTITATLSGSWGTATINKSVWVGLPPQVELITYDQMLEGFPSEICVSSLQATGEFAAGFAGVFHAPSQAYEGLWETDAGPILTDATPNTFNSVVVRLNNYGSRYIRVLQKNACGYSNFWTTQYFDLSYDAQGCSTGGGMLRLSPNPSDGDVTLEVVDEEGLNVYFQDASDPLRVVIRDLMGEAAYRGVLNRNGLQVNLKRAKKGIYVVEVYNKNYQQQLRLILE